MQRKSICVVGVGSFYLKLRESLSQRFSVTRLIDVRPPDELPLLDDEVAIFRQIRLGEVLGEHAEGVDAVLLLSPSGCHASQAIELIKRGIPCLVEKPIATSKSELDALSAMVTDTTRAYFSDYYADIRCLPLLWAVDLIPEDDWRSDYVNCESDVPAFDLAAVTHVDARICETYTSHDRPWLDDPSQGGVVRDMLVHLFAIAHRVFGEKKIQIDRVHLKDHVPGSKPGEYSSHSVLRAESTATVHGRLEAGPAFRFSVSKDSARQERAFGLYSADGFAEQQFSAGHPAYLELPPGLCHEIALAADVHDLVAESFSRWLDSAAGPYGWEVGKFAAEQCLRVLETEDSSEPDRRSLTKTVGTSTGGPALPLSRSETAGVAEASNAALEVRLNRRIFAVGVLSLGAQVAIGIRQDEQSTSQHKESQGVLTEMLDELHHRRLDEYESPQERLASLARLFGVPQEGTITLSPGSSHQYGVQVQRAAGDSYPHDANALEPFVHYRGSRVRVLKNTDVFPHESFGDTDLIVKTGSPTSSSLARMVMGETKGSTTPLVYAISEDHDVERIKVLSGMEGGWADKYAKRLIYLPNNDTVLHDENHLEPGSRRLAKDILLLSRVPVPGLGCDALLLSGAHGAGTQAAELLFRLEWPRAELDELLSVVGEARYWQAVFEVEDLRHYGMTTGHAIRLSRVVPPVSLVG